MKYLLLLANLIMALALGITYRKLPPQIPLFYSRPTGDTQLATWWMIFVLPLCMNVLYILNGFIGKKFFADQKFVLNLLYYSNLVIIVTFLIVFIKIIFLIT